MTPPITALLCSINHKGNVVIHTADSNATGRATAIQIITLISKLPLHKNTLCSVKLIIGISKQLLYSPSQAFWSTVWVQRTVAWKNSECCMEKGAGLNWEWECEWILWNVATLISFDWLEWGWSTQDLESLGVCWFLFSHSNQQLSDARKHWVKLSNCVIPCFNSSIKYWVTMKTNR